MPQLSIITVCYNPGNLLHKTVESVEAQYFQDFEYLVVDGNSKDNTISYLETLQHLPGFRFISEPDKGIYDAMNKGVAMSKGDYILFLNAGDTLKSPNTLSQIFAKHNNADFIYGDAELVDDASKVLGLMRNGAPEQLSWKSFIDGMVVCHQAILVKRGIAPFYNLDYKIAADIDWAIRCLKSAKTIHNTKMVISTFLAGGTSSQRKKTAWKERYSILKSHFGFWANLINHIKIVWRNVFK